MNINQLVSRLQYIGSRVTGLQSITFCPTPDAGLNGNTPLPRAWIDSNSLVIKQGTNYNQYNFNIRFLASEKGNSGFNQAQALAKAFMLLLLDDELVILDLDSTAKTIARYSDGGMQAISLEVKIYTSI